MSVISDAWRGRRGVSQALVREKARWIRPGFYFGLGFGVFWSGVSGELRSGSGKVAAAALDVFREEPPGLTETVSHPRVIATPHIGAQTAEAQARASEDIAQEVMAALRGESLRWKVA